MKGNKSAKVTKTSKVKDFVKKNKEAIFVGGMCAASYVVGWMLCKRTYRNTTFGKHLSGAINGGDMYYAESNLNMAGNDTVKGLTELGKRMMASDTINSTGKLITEDTKVTGLMVFMKKD